MWEIGHTRIWMACLAPKVLLVIACQSCGFLDLQEAKVSTLLDFLEKPKALRDVDLAERVRHHPPRL